MWVKVKDFAAGYDLTKRSHGLEEGKTEILLLMLFMKVK